MADVESYRLPRNALPRRYALELRPDLPAARFDGRVEVTLDVVAPTADLVLNAHQLEISSAELRAPDGATLSGEVTLDAVGQRATVHLGAAVRPAEGYVLTLDFSGVLNDQLRGFYRSTFTDRDGIEHVIATTQFESTDARQAFPCWDEPDMKAVFSVTLVVDEGLTGISNAGLESAVERSDGRFELRFADTMLMSTYLVAFVVGPYELTEPIDVGGTPLRIAAVRGKLGLTGFAEEAGAHALRFLSGYFGIPYPGAKIDHVAVPDFAFGAMENVGCVTYRESLLLVDPEQAAQTELQHVAEVIAHETAHMWFGNLVTMKWWNGIWLNEAFATFMELTTADDFRPEWQVWTIFGAGKAMALETDGLRSTRPVEYRVERPEEADGMFDVLTYQKGGSVLRMLEQYIGADVFRKGISHYLATHAYANTETADLWDALEAISGEPVRQIMESWIQQGGHPMVTAGLEADQSTVTLSQRRFLYDGGDGSAPGERWSIPVNLRASVEGRVHHERVLLDDGQASCQLPGPVDWVVVNDGAWGFYRTRYESELWSKLAAAGPRSVLSPLERLQVVGDVWAEVVAGSADLSGWAEVAAAVAADPDPDVWAAISSVLRTLQIAAATPGATPADAAAIADFARRLAAPVWEGVGWDPAPGENERVATARARLLGVLGRVGTQADVVGEAGRRFRAHLAGEVAGLSPDLIGTAARIAVHSGGAEIWSDVLAAYRSAERPQDRLRYLFSLTETPSPDLRERTLEMSIGGDVRSQDAPHLLTALMLQPGSAAPVWSWILGHWDALDRLLPPNLQMRTLEGASAVCDREVAAQVRDLFETRDLPLSPVRTAQVLESMDVHVALAERLHIHGIASALGR